MQVNLLYIEEEIVYHPRTRAICERFSTATKIRCDRYTEVFNPKSQNFRLQKRKPALILAKKHDGFVLPIPKGYGLGSLQNFYFSHMLNCIYDCRYCFLQGMYRSAHYVLFVNYEDFDQGIDQTLKGLTEKQVWFFSGYDCDSLALEPVTGFAQHFVPFFAKRPNACVELRTKSTQIRSLLEMQPTSNVVVAFSFTPDLVSKALEHKVPSVQKRLAAMARLQQAGWRLGLRFDPLIYEEEYQAHYQQLLADVFAALDTDSLHSVSLGPFRLPQQYYKNMVRLYPDEPLLAGPLERIEGMVSYSAARESQMTEFCTRELLKYVPKERLFPCSVSFR